jgi:hypothetical protein
MKKRSSLIERWRMSKITIMGAGSTVFANWLSEGLQFIWKVVERALIKCDQRPLCV